MQNMKLGRVRLLVDIYGDYTLEIVLCQAGRNRCDQLRVRFELSVLEYDR